MKLKQFLAFGLLFAFIQLIYSCNSKEQTVHKTHFAFEKASAESGPVFKITPVDYGTIGYDYANVIRKNPVIYNGFDVVSIDTVEFRALITERSNSPPQGINI